ncbi:hypothetical protein [Castellaniella sp.]
MVQNETDPRLLARLEYSPQSLIERHGSSLPIIAGQMAALRLPQSVLVVSNSGMKRLCLMICTLLSALTLAACANLTDIPPGTPLAQVVARFGPPTLQCTGRGGEPRVVWSQQPFGQYAWGATLDAQGNVQRIEPLLTDRHFSQLDDGQWTQAQVRCEFGPPAIVDTVGLPSNRQLVYSYRYRQDHVWNSLMFVFFDHDGTWVTRHHPGPDPLYEPREHFLAF